jgi:hypothetical protein
VLLEDAQCGLRRELDPDVLEDVERGSLELVELLVG